MVKTLYVCRECGFVFPSELRVLIERRVQVFCERCGMPFTLAGVEFKQPPVKQQITPVKSYYREAIKERSKKKLSKAIKKIDAFAFIPVLILSCVLLTTSWIFTDPANLVNGMIGNVLVSAAGLSIAYYDIKQITPKIKEEKYNELLLDSFCYGILGCIFYGSGVLILVKGILIFIYVAKYNKDKEHKAYKFGLKLKNSLNSFSTNAGFIILLMIIANLFITGINGYSIMGGIEFLIARIGPIDEILTIIILIVIILGILLIPILILLIDRRKKEEIWQKSEFTTSDALKVFILGLFGVAIFSMGIFILLKGILLFLLVAGKPFNWDKKLPVVVEEKRESELKKDPLKQVPEELLKKEDDSQLHLKRTGKLEKPQDKISKTERKQEEIVLEKETTKDTTKESSKVTSPQTSPITLKDDKKKEIKQDAEQLKLHESLLPVKDDKDKLMVKQYFTKIFTVLSEDTRKKLLELDIPQEDKMALLKELAYLAKEEQFKYIESIKQLYKEIPLKLIKRIKNLPSVKPEHYDKIIAQLNFMDDEEQFEFINFLEQNA
ncbi:MAG: hypothetical protein ACTSV5_11280 [Promethearchaeota archaeon]